MYRMRPVLTNGMEYGMLIHTVPGHRIICTVTNTLALNLHGEGALLGLCSFVKRSRHSDMPPYHDDDPFEQAQAYVCLVYAFHES